MNEFQAAIADFTVSIELNSVLANNDPRYAKPFVGRGIAKIQTGDLENALEDAEKALELLERQFDAPEWDHYQPTINLQLSDVHELLGDSYTALGRNTNAQIEYERSMKYRR